MFCGSRVIIVFLDIFLLNYSACVLFQWLNVALILAMTFFFSGKNVNYLSLYQLRSYLPIMVQLHDT